MRIIVFTLFVFLLSSCATTKYDKKVKIECDCYQSVEMFNLDAEKLFSKYDYSFKIINLDKGKFEAVKQVVINSKNIEFTIKIEIDDDDNEMEIKPIAKIITPSEVVTQYFDDKCYPDEYADHFVELINNIKANCSKVAFPNRK